MAERLKDYIPIVAKMHRIRADVKTIESDKGDCGVKIAVRVGKHSAAKEIFDEAALDVDQTSRLLFDLVATAAAAIEKDDQL